MSAATKKPLLEVVQNPKLEAAYHFHTAMYLIERPDFIPAVNDVSEEQLEKFRVGELDERYPARSSNNYFWDERVQGFANFITTTAWGILNEQGYAMQDRGVHFLEMWSQEHFKHSSTDAHVHSFGSQLTGFYFLEVPEKSSRIVFHDPRVGKVQIDLPERNYDAATAASRMINFPLRPGLMIFANAWLAHSFTPHAADEPLKFVHFNLGVHHNPNTSSAPAAEVV